MMNKQIKTAIVAAIFLVLGSGGYFAYKKYFSAQVVETPVTQPEAGSRLNTGQTSLAETPEKIIPQIITILPGFKIYKNSDFGFEIQYPQTWAVSEENIENVRGESTKAFYFKKPNSDLRFAILPRDGLSYGLPDGGDSKEIVIGGVLGSQTKWTLSDGRRLWLLNPQYGLHNWSQDIGRIDIQSSATDPMGDTVIFEKMLNSFKLSK